MFWYDTADLGDFANSVVNDAIKHSGVSKKGPEFELFKKEMTNAVKKRLDSQNILGGKEKPVGNMGNKKVVAEVAREDRAKVVQVNDSMIIEGILDNTKTRYQDVVQDLTNKIGEAKNLADNDVLKISSLTNKRKMTIRYKQEKVKATKESLEDGTFFSNLDKDSVPLYAWKDGDDFRLSSAAET